MPSVIDASVLCAGVRCGRAIEGLLSLCCGVNTSITGSEDIYSPVGSSHDVHGFHLIRDSDVTVSRC